MKKPFKILTVLALALTFFGCSSTSVESQAQAQTGISEPRGDVSAYLKGAHMSVDDAQKKLSEAGFEVLSTFESVNSGTTILYTCPRLKAEAAKPNRANIAVMRIFVDDEAKSISIANPVYFGKAYMQNDYNHETFTAIKDKIEEVFTGLTPSEDKMAFKNLAGFHFTIGMPYYEDVEVLGEGTNEELLAKLREYKKGKEIAFELKISDDTTLVGYELGRGTKRFVKKTGRENAGLLPWPIVVSGGKATMLKAEYYIALNYPLLGMLQFGGIASVPGDVIKDLNKPFK
ncbi:hypothetical protein [Sulfurimonas sp.]|jgi:hypothetical protein|uniref:hypothetical protein n=1 Tax=Sulfurimonas sp. TaxID=2022749 RepID=UPI0025D16BA3|nr:hypothetical protein [Sulfurimonas sp.]MCK9472241.1 hypothetical protein [Sulfurimonas sp.]MDD3505216.1 hypothetical protein [Sulfurimonas sp.]